MRTVYIDIDGNGCLVDRKDVVCDEIVKDVAYYFHLEKEELIELINDGIIDFVLRDQDDDLDDEYSRAKEELTIDTLKWYIDRDLKCFRERDKDITRADIMEAYLKAAAVYNVNWTNVGADYNRGDTADYLSDKGFRI